MEHAYTNVQSIVVQKTLYTHKCKIESKYFETD